MEERDEAKQAEIEEIVEKDQMEAEKHDLEPTASTEETVATEEKMQTEVVVASPEPKPKKSPKKLLLIIGIILLLGAAVGVTYYVTKKSVQRNSSTSSSATDQKTPLSTTEPATLPKEFAWLSAPLKVETLPIFKDVKAFIHNIDEQSTLTDAHRPTSCPVGPSTSHGANRRRPQAPPHLVTVGLHRQASPWPP
jgi:hypothetical protein